MACLVPVAPGVGEDEPLRRVQHVEADAHHHVRHLGDGVVVEVTREDGGGMKIVKEDDALLVGWMA